MNDNLVMKVGFLKPATTTVENGNHFRKIKDLIDDLVEDEFKTSIYCNKWLLTKMLELEKNWNDDAKQIYTLLHNQLSLNVKSNT